MRDEERRAALPAELRAEDDWARIRARGDAEFAQKNWRSAALFYGALLEAFDRKVHGALSSSPFEKHSRTKKWRARFLESVSLRRLKTKVSALSLSWACLDALSQRARSQATTIWTSRGLCAPWTAAHSSTRLAIWDFRWFLKVCRRQVYEARVYDRACAGKPT